VRPGCVEELQVEEVVCGDRCLANEHAEDGCWVPLPL
jgi:hypothetical protein